MPVDQSLIDEACAALDVEEIQTLRDGGQKSVRLVGRGDERFVVKVISTGQSTQRPRSTRPGRLCVRFSPWRWSKVF